MPRATTSRGASSPSGCTSNMKRRPASSSSTAPSPRTASETSGLPSTASAVGWNWVNSTSASAAPARNAAATPSPVVTLGLVVCRYSCPAPPLASTTMSASMTRVPAASTTSTPTTRPSSTTRSRMNVYSCTSTATARTARSRATSIASPVASPPAWMTRRAECAASWPRSSSPLIRSNSTPSAIRSRTRCGPSEHSTSTAAGSHRPAPARIVSAMCSCDAVIREQCRGDAALRVLRVALGELRLRHEDHLVPFARAVRGDESGDPGADDDHAAHARSPPSAETAWPPACVRGRCGREPRHPRAP